MDDVIRDFMNTRMPRSDSVVVVSTAVDESLCKGVRGPLFGTRMIEDETEVIRVLGFEPGLGEPLGDASSNGLPACPSGQLALAWSPAPEAWVDGRPAQLLRCTAAHYRDRVAALPGADLLTGARAALVGLGSVGSQIGRHLVTLGVGVTAFEPDVLTAENLVRWSLPVIPDEQVGRRKSRVFEEQLRASVPNCRLVAHPIDIVTQAPEFERHVEAARPQLMVIATDTRDSRRQANATALRLGIPAIYVGLSDGAASVRVEVVMPGSACHLCAVFAESGETAEAARRSRRPYASSSAATAAVPALPVDVGIGALVATRIALELLTGRDWRAWFHCGQQVGNVLFMSLQPDFWIFSEAWQRIVIQTMSRPECPGCGGVP